MSAVSPGTPIDPRHSGNAHLVVVHPPFAAPLRPGRRPAAVAHDARAARAAVRSLSAVAAIRREQAPSPLEHPRRPETRDDLDTVRAASWGTTVRISDPALLEDGVLSSALEDEFRAQKKHHPDARIVAVCERDFGSAYTKILVAVPGTPDVTIEGFDELDVVGDRLAALTAVGLDPDRYGEAFDVDDDGYFDYDAFLHVLTGGALTLYADETRRETEFAVDRTQDGEDAIREVWFP